MSLFNHFVITRFNLDLGKSFQIDKNKKATLTEEWLEHRFDLFDKICFPSLQGQSSLNFIWLVLFSSNIPDLFKEKIKTYQKSFNNFHPLFLETGERTYLRNFLVHSILSLSHPGIQYIITTRIDNDDAFQIDMINEVQRFFSTNCSEGFLNFNYGLQFDFSKLIAVKIRYENNHFLSRMEKKTSQLETVLFHNHIQVDKIDKSFLWKTKLNQCGWK